MNHLTDGGRRGRHRRRRTATGLVLGVPAVLVPYLLFAQEDSQAATVDGDACYRLVSVRSGKVLDVDGFSTADGTRIQQWPDENTANQQWRLRPTGDGYYELVNRNSGKVLGIAGNSKARSVWIAGSTKGLLHSTDGGRTFTTLKTVRSASALGFGKAKPGARYQALYLIGTVKDVTGVFRSTDKGATWLRVNDKAHQWGAIGGVITGDPDAYGRVYVGTNGRGLQYGDPS
ncbi:hypothetical protein ADK65_01700 [Streptomyces sp. NRRL B-1140]|uniref:RICIN domain-containing protein n=1 Tax=Streptomyces sp. NRRL B-1140 TaxID=1415549 RepID=UPI0006ADDF1B|nr:RICIN domain-containing protein [Streptomyces sp. NRRL B-1140]KOX06474.1 hypothetical protein ADK65_01700 [Streptomyces sp. NRRL B-1140]